MACQRVNTFALLKQIFKIPTRFLTTFKHLALVGHVSSGLIETSVKEKEDHSVLENAGQWYEFWKKFNLGTGSALCLETSWKPLHFQGVHKA